MKYKILQDVLGYTFSDRALLIQSLTHSSYGHEFLKDRPISSRHNERLEFLGDSILSMVVTDLLLEIFPEGHEGQLSKIRAAIVSEKSLCEVAKNLSLQECIQLGRGEKNSGGSFKSSILAGAFEALIGAIYIDGGFRAVFPIVRFLFSPFFKIELGPFGLIDHKTKLQEILQSKHKVTPTYVLRKASGPDHAKTFEVEVRLKTEILAVASGLSKKEAEQNAAKMAVEKFHELLGQSL